MHEQHCELNVLYKPALRPLTPQATNTVWFCKRIRSWNEISDGHHTTYIYQLQHFIQCSSLLSAGVSGRCVSPYHSDRREGTHTDNSIHFGAISRIDYGTSQAVKHQNMPVSILKWLSFQTPTWPRPFEQPKNTMFHKRLPLKEQGFKYLKNASGRDYNTSVPSTKAISPSRFTRFFVNLPQNNT